MKYLLLALFLCNSINAQDVFNPESSEGELFQYAKYTNVGLENLSLNQVLKDSTIIFSRLESENQNVGFTSNHFWVKFSLANFNDESKTHYLETARPITDIVDLYQIGETIQHFKSGDQIPFKERQVNHHSTVFKIKLPKASTQQIYIHYKSDGETLNLPLNLYDENAFWLENYKQQLFLGLFYGILFLAGIVYLFFFTSLKAKAFLYYGFYVFSIAFLQAALDGFIFQYIFFEGGYINSRAVLITALFSNFFLLKYCEHFLNIKEHLKVISKLYKAIYVVIAVLFLMVFINEVTLKYVYPISNVNGLFSLVLILASIFLMRYKRIKVDPFFSIGIFFLVIGLLGFVMNNLSLLPNNFITLNSAKFGAGFEVVFLSLSMTNLIKRLRLEKERSQEEALKKSEEISELKTYFMSNISHELRTPINAIMGVAEVQLEQNNNNEERKHYEVIKNASLSLLSNVNDILDFEKIEKNELVLQEEEFNPSIVLNQISNNWKIEAQNKNLDYTFEMDYEIPTMVKGDQERFVQIINNILSNAVKFTKRGKVIFKLRCTPQPNDEYRFSFHVSDTGIGMDAKTKDNVFDSFNQMRLNHSRQFGGIGLGLTIVKHLVNLFNGTISIESKINSGTDVYIDIPIKSATKKIKNPSIRDKTLKKEKPLHVLVVEDNLLNQMVMRKLLGSWPHISFVVVNNGKEAIETLKKDVYDIVLMDLQMPIMDGYEATKIIRSGMLGETIGSVPIIAVTADAMQETKQKVLNLGMNDYMTKPVKKELLYKKINNQLAELKIA